jgi:Cu(I)/Ag(I) efflux system membrane protein CusA/SilA
VHHVSAALPQRPGGEPDAAVGVLMAFGAMKLLGLGSNIMRLGGIAIAIGAMVDAAIVMIENAHHCSRGPRA